MIIFASIVSKNIIKKIKNKEDELFPIEKIRRSKSGDKFSGLEKQFNKIVIKIKTKEEKLEKIRRTSKAGDNFSDLEKQFNKIVESVTESSTLKDNMLQLRL